MILTIIAAAIPAAWWAAIDRRHFLLLRAYRRYRPFVRSQADIRFMAALAQEHREAKRVAKSEKGDIESCPT